MRDPREALSAVLAEQSPDDDDLRDWLTDRAAFVLDALEAEGYRIVGEGQACIGGEVVTLSEAWMDQCTAFVIDDQATADWQADEEGT